MGIDEGKLTKGQVRKLNALRKSVGDELGEDVFRKWLTRQAAASAPKVDPVAAMIEEALANFDNDRKFNLGVYGYTVQRARGRGKSGFVAIRNTKRT